MLQSQLDIAIKVAALGEKIFPQGRNKKPLIKEWPIKAISDEVQIREWAKKWPTCNFAVATGKRSGILVLDIDVKNDQLGAESLAKLEKQCGKVETFTVRTPSDGRHLYFKYPANNSKIKNCELKEYPGIEIKADGGGVTLPGSFYADGREYTLLDNREPTECPDWLIKLLQSNSYVKKAVITDGGGDIKDGARNSTLTSLAGGMRRQGNSQEAITAALLEENRTRCNPPLSEEVIKTIAASVCRYDPADPLIAARRTDTGNAMRMLHLFGDEIRFCANFNTWFCWDGKRWARDETRKILVRGWQVIDQVCRVAGTIPDPVQRADFLKYVVGFDRLAKVRAMCEFTSAIPKIAVKPDMLDVDGWLLNCKNGTLELKTMILREHRQADLITRLAPVEYDRDARCPLWFEFLTRITGDDPELLYFLQQAVGYSLTGDITEQVLFLLYGLGANGKSTFIETIAALLGDYSAGTPTETLLVKRSEGIPNDLARLQKVRMVYANETAKNRSMAESLVKQLTGGDMITARFLHAEFFEFQPEFKLFMCTNHKPRIKGTDHAIWRRVKLIPFTVQIPEDEQDKRLKEKLLLELPGILNWALEGCVAWQKDGLHFPRAVVEATKEYRIDSDIFGTFLSERCETGRAFDLTAAALYLSYENWCDESGERAISKTALGREMTDRGFIGEYRSHKRVWRGIQLLPITEKEDGE